MMCRYGIGIGACGQRSDEAARADRQSVMGAPSSRRWRVSYDGSSPVRGAAVQVVVDPGARVDWSKGKVRVTAGRCLHRKSHCGPAEELPRRAWLREPEKL